MGVRLGLLALGAVLFVAAPAHAAPPVVAILGESDGFNPLHQEFRATGPVDYPAGMPAPTFIDLPQGGTFAEQLAELRRGPLAHLTPGVLYAIRGTRVLVVDTGSPSSFSDAIPDSSGDPTSDSFSVSTYPPRTHGTGVLDSAIGTEVGTAPDALAVFVTDSFTSSEAWTWIAAQPWIDAVSMSGYATDPTCNAATSVRRAVAGGQLVFSSSGNTTDAGEQQVAPNGLPETYLVGAVNADGRTLLPGDIVNPDEPEWSYLTPTRPYETGALGYFTAAGPDSFDGTRTFGATSGATPKTAGYALRLIAAARAILGGGRNGAALATLGPGGTAPPRGPLADGSLTLPELTDLLHHTAAPYEQPSAERYLIEGYGAVTDATVALATKVLTGEVAEPLRPDEDAMQDKVTSARRANFDARCP